jgi:hypothetical protein
MICKYARTYKMKRTGALITVGCDFEDRYFNCEEDPCSTCVINTSTVIKEELKPINLLMKGIR